MGKIGITLSFMVFILVTTGCKKQANDVLYDRKYIDEIKASRKHIVSFLTSNFIPGGTFAIALEGEIIYSEGMGMASKDLETPVTRQTKFRIGELSQLFTSLIYQKLAEENTLHPDSSVAYYWPEFAGKKHRVPLHRLLSHTSGLRQPSPEEDESLGLNISLQRGIGFFAGDSLSLPPGRMQLTSMFNYNLLGAIMEKKTGKTFSSLLQEYVTDTLGLANTTIDNPFVTIKGRSVFFNHNSIAYIVHDTSRDLRFRAPYEGLLSNAEDLVKFGDALLHSPYFTEAIKKSLFEPAELDDGTTSTLNNGWLVMTDEAGRTIYGNIGDVPGGGAALIVYPEEKLVVACATNAGTLNEDYPVFEMAGKFLTHTAAE